MTWNNSPSFLSVICLNLLLLISTFCYGSPAEVPNNEDGVPNRPINPSEIEKGLNVPDEKSGPVVLNEKASEIKRRTSEPAGDGTNRHGGLTELTGQTVPLQINPQSSYTQLRERPVQQEQQGRPNIYDNGDYALLNRLRLPFRSFEDIPLRSFYESGIDNTPFGVYRGDRFNRGPYRSDRGQNADDTSYNSYIGSVGQGTPFIPQQNSFGDGRQIMPQYGPVAQSRSFASQPGQNIIQRPIPTQYNVAPDKPQLPYQIPAGAGKLFQYRGDVLDKPSTPHRGTPVLDKVFIPTKDGLSLDKPSSQQTSTVAIDKPAVLHHETILADKPFHLQQREVDSDKPVDEKNVDYQFKYDNPEGVRCHPNQAWKALLDGNSGASNARE